MVTGGVAKEIGVIGGEEGFAAEGGDARATAMAETRGGLDDEAFVGGKPGLTETIVEARAEVHVLPPCGLEGGVEAA